MENDPKNKADVDSDAMLDLKTLALEEPAEGLFYAYANLVNINWTLTDVQLRFGELLQVPDDDKPTWDKQRGIILERASVTIPWIQAKHLRNVLDGLIRNYETINGELKNAKLPAPPG